MKSKKGGKDEEVNGQGAKRGAPAPHGQKSCVIIIIIYTVLLSHKVWSTECFRGCFQHQHPCHPHCHLMSCFLSRKFIIMTRCLTLLEIQEICWNYFSSWKSWKSSGNLQNLLEIFWLSLCVCCYYDSHNSCISKCISSVLLVVVGWHCDRRQMGPVTTCFFLYVKIHLSKTSNSTELSSECLLETLGSLLEIRPADLLDILYDGFWQISWKLLITLQTLVFIEC